MKYIILFIIILSPCSAMSYNLRQISSKNGLSNSAILSIYQDRKGFMWFGSCDGLNMFDGINIQIYKPTNGNNNLSGNLIESIHEIDEDIFWIQTNYGLDRLDRRTGTIKSYKEFKSKNLFAKSMHNDIFIIKDDKYIYYLKQGSDIFRKIFDDAISFNNVLDMVIDKNNILWIFSKDMKCMSYTIETTTDDIKIKPVSLFEHQTDLLYCFHEGNIIYFVDSEYILYEYDLINKKKYYIHDLKNEIQKKGGISSIIRYHDDYLIGFKSNGLVWLKNIPDQKNNYQTSEIDIKSGIFCLTKDKNQDIIWVGTDGQGAFMFFMDSYSIKSTTFDKFIYPINNPIRALLLDKDNTLWIGTKGDGILKIYNYDYENGNNSRMEHILSSNSPLNDNAVYSFAKSRKNILWIGNEEGINYFSYKEKKIKKLSLEIDNRPVRFVHSICEFNDSTLWIATVGDGIIKAKYSGSVDNPVITETKRIVLDKGKTSSNYFFTSYKENDSIIWFGNRGYGAFRLNTITEELKTFQFDKNNSNQTLNDVFSIAKSDDGYWFGTSFGLTRLHEDTEEIFNETTGFPNNTIHAIVVDNNNNLWLSTNQGVVKFNIKQNTFQTYKQEDDLAITEFSDGAYFKDKATGSLFFGGINGFISIKANETKQKEYLPSIQFSKLSIFGKDCNIYDYFSENEEKILELDYSQNFFSISFSAIDYINGNSYTYLYKLDELSSNWIESNSNMATFTDISPGRYTLYVKYINPANGNESPVFPLSIKINPPWYRTNLAYIIYSLVILLLIYLGIRISLKWYRMKKNSMLERLNRQQKEEIYESKLRFFTNITHELCTPLTLIYGPCEKIISYSKTDNYIHKYASLIQNNAEKLNGLIQELIEFRRLETDNKKLIINRLSVSEIIAEIAESFLELSETKNIDYQIKIKPDMIWNSDMSCLVKIVNNLISNAFKYTPEQGSIIVEAHIESENLYITISNTGKGIKEENISKIFDRYKILDNLEMPENKGHLARNGLGLAICSSMVKLLKGEIDVISVLNEQTSFKVVLPFWEINPEDEIVEDKILVPNTENTIVLEQSVQVYDKNKPSIMIVDDDPEMLWFISEIFMEMYNIIPVSDPQEVMELLNKRQPDLIISDVMMPGTDGISLTKLLKKDKLFSHIPLILLSAKNNPDEQVRGIEAGADVYITKPFDIKYLEKIVNRLLQRKEDLKEYYNSALSVFESEDGHFLHKDDKAFFEKMIHIIEINVMNPDLSVELLSSSLGYSTRQLYRKLKNITEKSPSDIIREYRLSIVEHLLTNTNLSIDEILYKAGFSNRGNFFKLFTQRYGTTPKSYRNMKMRELDKHE
ncbi:signal transduction histidine kinase/ligand-binding sensor domain-containing protein/AraC-like DNA-binding protein [Dysgonomonas hofstadii]|uniref:histidine kinase n=1 Tax=Dysgonomonas hofstadii TaxID=637886 RepID=A0A840CG00_9BACT|nr:hybrid sensor histidine kinase/response regulator transcription factor [Dysgonomonas hofstadii]MBB4034917.1 signal transduction histidine kinase/ligand-binding sensor domain-containing protein/AraC-like DNA-binding protein [Dysgonomonas hofstadii]